MDGQIFPEIAESIQRLNTSNQATMTDEAWFYIEPILKGLKMEYTAEAYGAHVLKVRLIID